MSREESRSVLALMVLLIGLNTAVVAFIGGYCLSLQHQLDQLERRYGQ